VNFDKYQEESKKTARYLHKNRYSYTALGLSGEVGEVSEHVKRILRGEDNGEMSKERVKNLKKELGDVLWYLTQLATELGISLDDIATENLKKLFSRKKREKLHGKGDNR